MSKISWIKENVFKISRICAIPSSYGGYLSFYLY